MSRLIAEQRADFFSQAAVRTGIHASLLAALSEVHLAPQLGDRETGLGIAPADQIPWEAVDTFAGQVYYAANTLVCLMQFLLAQGWRGADFWSSEQGRYSDKFLRIVANGFVASAVLSVEPLANSAIATLPGARLEYADYETLRDAYLQQIASDMRLTGIPANQTFVESALRAFAEPLPSQYVRLAYQRSALLELVRLWHQLENHTAAIAHLAKTDPAIADEFTLDSALLRGLQQLLASYTGLPHQREAFLRLVQGWQQLPSRSATLLALQQAIVPKLETTWLDAALIALIQRIPQLYEGKGDQRNALVESFRQWQRLESRPATLIALGVSPDLFTGDPSPTDIARAAEQTDRALLSFVSQIPFAYRATPYQRDTLIYLTQLWRGLSTADQAIQCLIEDFQQLETARRDSPESPLPPRSLPLTTLPQTWTVDSIQLHAAIAPASSFTWATATHGGLTLPTNQASVDAIVKMATQLQIIRDRLNRPLSIVRWYALPGKEMGRFIGDRHALGDGVLLYCDGLTANQLYWFLDPAWSGGLGCYAQFPNLCYMDLRGDRVRWKSL
jgi:hypothetical protein